MQNHMTDETNPPINFWVVPEPVMIVTHQTALHNKRSLNVDLYKVSELILIDFYFLFLPLLRLPTFLAGFF